MNAFSLSDDVGVVEIRYDALLTVLSLITAIILVVVVVVVAVAVAGGMTAKVDVGE
jgi:NO-binding membrane sensor protein with MHYT domain